MGSKQSIVVSIVVVTADERSGTQQARDGVVGAGLDSLRCSCMHHAPPSRRRLHAAIVAPRVFFAAIRKESCWTISNIMAGNVEQIQAVLDANVIPVLLQLLRNGEWEVRKEACWAISNATSGGSNDQIAFLVTNGCLHPLAQMLKVEDTKIVMVALEGEAAVEGQEQQATRPSAAVARQRVGGIGCYASVYSRTHLTFILTRCSLRIFLAGIENILRRGAGTKEHPVTADLNPYVTFAGG